MREIELTRFDLKWKRLTNSISAKLIGSLLAVMVVIFALLGYLNIRLHRQHLEAATLASAERVSDVIKRSTTYYMLRNDREGLYHSIQTIADEFGSNALVPRVDRDHDALALALRLIDKLSAALHVSRNRNQIRRVQNRIRRAHAIQTPDVPLCFS